MPAQERCHVERQETVSPSSHLFGATVNLRSKSDLPAGSGGTDDILSRTMRMARSNDAPDWRGRHPPTAQQREKRNTPWTRSKKAVSLSLALCCFASAIRALACWTSGSCSNGGCGTFRPMSTTRRGVVYCGEASDGVDETGARIAEEEEEDDDDEVDEGEEEDVVECEDDVPIAPSRRNVPSTPSCQSPDPLS